MKEKINIDTPQNNHLNRTKQSIQFKDNRSEATTQLKVQEMANQPIQKKENKTGMPDNLKSGIENLSGMDMSDVKVYYNSPQPAQLQAHAFAQGNQIHIASGQERHLPHEAWHVVQQKQGRVQTTKQLKGKVNINDDSGLEREADVMGAKAIARSNIIQRKLNSKSIVSGVIQRATKIDYFPRTFDYIDSIKGAKKEIVGYEMRARLDPTDEIKGSEPGSGVQSGIMSSLKSIGIKRMIRGHLMNGQMGGLGIAANLFPITAHANSKHKSYMENYVKGQLFEENKKKSTGTPDDIYYQVKVIPKGTGPVPHGWSDIDVDFQCVAYTNGGWNHAINIESRPTKNAKNKGGEGGPSIKPAIIGRAEGKPPSPWGQAGDGYDKYDADHQKTFAKSNFTYLGHDLIPDNDLYTRGLHFNEGEIDPEKLETFELFWKLEAIVSNVKMEYKGKILKESDIESMSNLDLQILATLLKKEIKYREKVSESMLLKAKAYAKDEPKKTAIATTAAIGTGLILGTSYFWTGGITLGISAVAWYLHEKNYI